MKRSILPLIVAVVITACTSPEKAVIHRPTTKGDRVLDFRFGGAWHEHIRYVVDGTQAWKEVRKPRALRGGVTDYPIRTQIQVFPSPKKWQTFWQEIDQLRVNR